MIIKVIPIILTPAIANAFAESPSVNMSVQDPEFRVPASLASSSFSMPNSLLFLTPFRVFSSAVCSRASKI